MASGFNVRLRLAGVATMVSLVTLGLLGLAACGSSAKKTGTSPSSSAGGAAGGEVITIHNFSFSPTPLPAKVGDTVTVTNKDNTNHTFTADDNSFDIGPFSSGSKTVKMSKAGTIAYHCKIHPFMHGTLQVSS